MKRRGGEEEEKEGRRGQDAVQVKELGTDTQTHMPLQESDFVHVCVSVCVCVCPGGASLSSSVPTSSLFPYSPSHGLYSLRYESDLCGWY